MQTYKICFIIASILGGFFLFGVIDILMEERMLDPMFVLIDLGLIISVVSVGLIIKQRHDKIKINDLT